MAPRKPEGIELWSRRIDGVLHSIRSALENLEGQQVRRGPIDSSNPGDRLNAKFELADRELKIAIPLLKSLEEFTKGQCNFFLDKYKNMLAGSDQLIDKPPKGELHQNAIALTLKQASADLATITLALAQRASVLGGDDAVRKRLDLADYLAESTLKEAEEYFPDYTESNGERKYQLNKPVVLTYLNKSPLIRVVPYARVALIGLPYTCLTESRDLLALAHEIGHYLYWNGHSPLALRKKDEVSSFFYRLPILAEKNSEYPMWLRKWVEEVFADTFGAVIAGALISLDFQDLMMEGADAEEFVEDDGEHPWPLLRPEIYLEVLRNRRATRFIKPLSVHWRKLITAANRKQVALRPRDLSCVPITATAPELLESLTRDVLDELGLTRKVKRHFSEGVTAPIVNGGVWKLSAKNQNKAARKIRFLYQAWESKVNQWLGNRQKPKELEQPFPVIPYDKINREILDEAKRAKIFFDGKSDDDIIWYATRLAGGWTEGPSGPKSSGGG